MIRFSQLSFIFIVVIFFLASCGGGDSSGGDNNTVDEPTPVPTDSTLVTSRSPDHNEINVSEKTGINITVDQSIINNGLDLVLFYVGKNENCQYIRGDGPNCPWTDTDIIFTNAVVQGNSIVFTPNIELEFGSNYVVFLRDNSDDFLLQWSIRTNPGGVFLDSPVINIGYRTETLNGVTNEKGIYAYILGESVTFFIGDLVFPTVTAKSSVTPLDLAGTTDINDPKVVNMIRLLQTLDEDENPQNGLTITDSAKTAATQIDFTLSLLDFENSVAVKALISNAGQINPVSNLVTTTRAVSNFQFQLDTLDKLNFKASTLPGIYNVSAFGVSGTHQLTFIAGGSVNIIWGDGSTDTGTWSVNSSGQLLLSGLSFSDVLTLTSGDQSSGGLDLVLDDEDGVLKTTGTIKLISFDGSYNVTLTSVTSLNSFNVPCENASGVMNINNSIASGSLSGASGGTASISGDVQSDGSILGSLVTSTFFTNFTGVISGTSGSGTWSEQFGCAGTWEMTKN